MKIHSFTGTVEADCISVEDGGSARIATISPDEMKEDDSGLFVRIISWDEASEVPTHPDFEKLFGLCKDRKSLFQGKKKIKIIIEVED